MAAKTKTNIITALTTLPQGRVSAHKDQYATAISHVGRIFVGLSWELHCRWQDRALDGRQREKKGS